MFNNKCIIQALNYGRQCLLLHPLLLMCCPPLENSLLINLWWEKFSILNKSAGREMRWWQNLSGACSCQNAFKAAGRSASALTLVTILSQSEQDRLFLLGSRSTALHADFNRKRNDAGERKSNLLDRNITLSFRKKEKEEAAAP